MKVAVVGSGVSGLAATWLLNEHSEHEVHLFERNDYIGGHTHTVTFTPPAASASANAQPPSCSVDTGFIVFNTVTYPNLLNFFKHLKVPYINSDMSFSVSRDRGVFEWAGGSPGQLFAQASNLWRLTHWRMVYDILRFNRSAAVDLLSPESSYDPDISIGSYLARHGYSASFARDYLIPMTSAIWSTPPSACALDFPAVTLVRFMHNHHLLQILGRPTWLTVAGGSQAYVSRVVGRLPSGRVRLGCPVVSVQPEGDAEQEQGQGRRWRLRGQGGKDLGAYDHVVMAAHADESLALLGSHATPSEKAVLSAFEFAQNTAVLHADDSPESGLVPRRRKCWSSWNFLARTTGSGRDVDQVSLTYWMNLLQSIPEATYGPVLVTLNPPVPPKPSLTLGSWSYSHPQFTARSVAAQRLLPTLDEGNNGGDGRQQEQERRGLSFVGAWTKYGFHEDGLTSGLKAAAALGAECPFPIALSAERDPPPPPPFYLSLSALTFVTVAVLGWLCALHSWGGGNL